MVDQLHPPVTVADEVASVSRISRVHPRVWSALNLGLFVLPQLSILREQQVLAFVDSWSWQSRVINCVLGLAPRKVCCWQHHGVVLNVLWFQHWLVEEVVYVVLTSFARLLKIA